MSIKKYNITNCLRTDNFKNLLIIVLDVAIELFYIFCSDFI